MRRVFLVSCVVLLLAATWSLAGTEDLLASREKFYAPRLGDRVPRDLTFRDETGKTVRLSDYGNTKPIILVLAYYRCPILCTMVLNDLVKGLIGVPFTAGNEFDVV